MNYLQKQNDLQNQVDELLDLVWKKQKRIRELESAVRDLLITDKPAAWRLHLGESRYNEIKALEQQR